jgi:hypothetical protein
MKAYWESGGTAPRILSPRHYMEMSGQLHAPAALPQGKSPWYALDRRLGGPQSGSGRGGEEKNPSPAGNRTLEPRTSSPQPSAIPNQLSRLSFNANSKRKVFCTSVYNF